MADSCCENCGWSEIVGSPIMCNYNGHRTWRDECCEAWKAKKEEMNMVKVDRCKDCKYAEHWYGDKSRCFLWSETGIDVFEDGYCNYGKPKDGEKE